MSELLNTEKTAWGWLSADGQPQDKTFDTAEEAIKAMQGRLGGEYTLEELVQYGFRLARVRITIEAIQVLTSI